VVEYYFLPFKLVINQFWGRYLHGWRDLSLEQAEDATSDIDARQDPRFGCGTLRAVRVGKPWRRPEAQRLIDEHPSLSELSEDITAAIVLLKCAEDKMFSLLPRAEFASPS
jgi:hypothetical protein